LRPREPFLCVFKNCRYRYMYSAYVSFSKVSKFLVSIIKTIDLKDSIKGVFFFFD